MRKTLGYLTALGLLAGLSPAAYAAGTPVLTYQDRGGSAVLMVEGMEGSVYGAQIELEVDGSYSQSQVSFTPNEPSVYPQWRAETSGGKTKVIIYLAPERDTPLRGNQIELGELDMGERFSMPGKASLTLLSQGLEPYEEVNGTGGVKNVTVRPSSGGSSQNPGGSSGSDTEDGEETYRVSLGDTEHGSIKVSHSRAEHGTKITVTPIPDRGYELDDLWVTNAKGDAVALKENKNGSFTFTMPRSRVEIFASFHPVESEPDNKPQTPPSYVDVAPDAWYYDAVNYVSQENLMLGVGDNRFGPDGTTTRSMIVTILYRLEGSPRTGGSQFTDVPAGQFYSDAVAWASDNGIVAGYPDGRFGPSDPITREQMAAILYRYAGYKGQDVSAQADLSGYGDAGTISQYALPALGWANRQGLITGTDTNLLLPTGSATRAQVASILMRFCQNVL